MNDLQIIAEICKKFKLHYTLHDIESLLTLCRNYYTNRKFLESTDSYKEYHGE